MSTAARHTEIAEMCSIQVGGTLYGIAIHSILEILSATRPRAVPLAPSFIGGLVHYRGDALTTVSLRCLLGLPPSSKDPAVVVLEGEGGMFGLAVDSVGEVRNVSKDAYEENSSQAKGRCAALIAGAYKLPEGLLLVLDAARLEPSRLSHTSD